MHTPQTLVPETLLNLIIAASGQSRRRKSRIDRVRRSIIRDVSSVRSHRHRATSLSTDSPVIPFAMAVATRERFRPEVQHPRNRNCLEEPRSSMHGVRRHRSCLRRKTRDAETRVRCRCVRVPIRARIRRFWRIIRQLIIRPASPNILQDRVRSATRPLSASWTNSHDTRHFFSSAQPLIARSCATTDRSKSCRSVETLA